MLLPFAILLLSAPLCAQAGGAFQEDLRFQGEHSFDSLGAAVSRAGDLDGDGVQDFLTGAPFADANGIIASGRVYVRSGRNGALLYTLEGTGIFHNFGSSVSQLGDVNNDGVDDFLVGAPGTRVNGMNSVGTVYVYSGANGNELFRKNGSATLDLFGSHVSAAGDVDQDGVPDFVVGLPHIEAGGMANAGSAKVYSGATGALLYQFDGTLLYQGLGREATGAGDVNNDGFDDIIVGAISGTLIDTAMIFSGANGSLLYTLQGGGNDYHGISVAGLGDINNDGFDDVAVGASLSDTQGLVDNGSLFVYSGIDGSILYRVDGLNSNDKLGGSVSSAGDFDHDGVADFMGAAQGVDHNGLNLAGSVYIYSGATGALISEIAFTEEGSTLRKFSLDLVGDLSGDGYSDIIIGDPEATQPLQDSGTTFVYGFNPFLSPSVNTISAASGGIITYDLDFSAEAGLFEYRILISASGPGQFRFGIDIPLSLDNLVLQTANGNYPTGFTQGFSGVLTFPGRASGSVTLPAGALSSLIGTTLYLAAVANEAGQRPSFSSVAVPLEILP
ncbi:MAG: integrin alpha [Planctomycetota bacterium]